MIMGFQEVFQSSFLSDTEALRADGTTFAISLLEMEWHGGSFQNGQKEMGLPGFYFTPGPL